MGLLYSNLAFTENQSLTCGQIFTRAFIDFHSEWGVHLIPEDDPLWSDPTYIEKLIQYSAPQNTDYNGKAQHVYRAYTDELKLIGADGKPLALTNSGTAANNLTFQLIQAHQHYNLHPKANMPVKFLTLGPIYSGANGPITYHGSSTQSISVEKTPLISPNKPLEDYELEEIKRKEKDALEEIENYLKKTDENYGAIFLEVSTLDKRKGLSTYRTDFLIALKELSQRHGVLIVVDEILSGLRTGKVWSYQHKEGFTPDLVTFGKGFVVSGVFKPSGSRYNGTNPLEGVTSQFNPLVLIQATHVLKAIRERELLKQSLIVGDYLRNKIIDFHTEYFSFDEDEKDRLVRHMGLLQTAKVDWSLTLNSNYRVGLSSIGRYGTRLMPPLTLTTSDIDIIFRRD